MTSRPEFCTDAHLQFLDNLRESGVTNMYGAAPYLEQVYPELKREGARKVLGYWMETFGQEDR